MDPVDGKPTGLIARERARQKSRQRYTPATEIEQVEVKKKLIKKDDSEKEFESVLQSIIQGDKSQQPETLTDQRPIGRAERVRAPAREIIRQSLYKRDYGNN